MTTRAQVGSWVKKYLHEWETAAPAYPLRRCLAKTRSITNGRTRFAGRPFGDCRGLAQQTTVTGGVLEFLLEDSNDYWRHGGPWHQSFTKSLALLRISEQ